MLGQFNQLLNALFLEATYRRSCYSSRGRMVLCNLRYLSRHLYV